MEWKKVNIFSACLELEQHQYSHLPYLNECGINYSSHIRTIDLNCFLLLLFQMNSSFPYTNSSSSNSSSQSSSSSAFKSSSATASNKKRYSGSSLSSGSGNSGCNTQYNQQNTTLKVEEEGDREKAAAAAAASSSSSSSFADIQNPDKIETVCETTRQESLAAVIPPLSTATTSFKDRIRHFSESHSAKKKRIQCSSTGANVAKKMEHDSHHQQQSMVAAATAAPLYPMEGKR